MPTVLSKEESVRLETDRLIMRQWHSADYAPFAALNADARVMKYFPAPLSKEQSDAMADRCRQLMADRGWGLWALESRQTGRFIGYTGLHIPAAPLPFCPCVEVGWRLEIASWGKGYATEAAQAALRYGFVRLALHEIVSFTAVDNKRSRAVMERLGMLEASETFDHPSLPPGSALRRHCLYRLSQSQWTEMHSGH